MKKRGLSQRRWLHLEESFGVRHCEKGFEMDLERVWKMSGICFESRTVFVQDRKGQLLLLRNKGYLLLKRGQYLLFIHFSPHSLIVVS